MSDNLRRYRAIQDALTQYYPDPPTGTVARHLTTLAALISGIVGSKSTQLPSVATKIPDGAKSESRVERLTRWLDNERIFGGGLLFTVCRYLIDAASHQDIGGSHGWQCGQRTGAAWR